MTSDDTELWCVLHDWPSAKCAHVKHGEKHECGYVEDTFACRIRHQHINTGDAKATKDGNRWDRARDLHQDTFNRGL